MQTAELLKKVRRLEIRSRHLVADLFAGRSSSVFKGRGMEFEEVRPYVPGDEVRDIDWNVTARFGVPFIKRFSEERELTVMLVADVSRSMRFGTSGTNKQELVAELCAVLGFAAITHNDRVGLLLVSDKVEHFVPPSRGRTHLLRLLRDLIDSDFSSRRTSLVEGARFLLRTMPRRTLVFWISDFQDTLEPRDFRVLSRRHELTALVLRDPADSAMPGSGWTMLEDLESGGTRLVHLGSKGLRERYAADDQQRSASAARVLSDVRCPVLEISTDKSYLPVLIRYFATRRKGRLRA
jgi:uncharacterized protein (DUF58 family)